MVSKLFEKLRKYLELKKYQKSRIHYLTVAADLIISSAVLRKLGYSKDISFKKYTLDERVHVNFTLKKDNEDNSNSIESYILRECKDLAYVKSIDFKELVYLCKNHGYFSFTKPSHKSLNTDVDKSQLRLVQEVLNYYGFNINSLNKTSLNYKLYIEAFRKNFKEKIYWSQDESAKI